MLSRRRALGLLALAPALPAAAGAAERWRPLDRLAEEAVAAGDLPGLVLLVGHGERVLYRRASGSRSLRPARAPMTLDTVFDLASLTKVVATTSSLMALLDEGRLRLRDPAARFWPEFGRNGKEGVTVRHLLTHTSGLPAWENYWKKLAAPEGPPVQDLREQLLAEVAAAGLRQPPDTRFVYSDLGFIALGEIVRRAAGEALERYAARRIFLPLGMRETVFNPAGPLRERAAPTTERAGVMLRGQVHDENAAACGGVAGHAGLFSTVDDLARFARMLTGGEGDRGGSYPLSPAAIRLMTTPQTPPGLPLRGLGWDIDSSYSHVRGDLMPLGSFGHTGFTGTYLWVDPYSRTYLIGLSNRLHPDGAGNPLRLWARAANAVVAILRLPPPARRPPLAPAAAALPVP